MDAEEVKFKLDIERAAERDDRAGRPAFARDDAMRAHCRIRLDARRQEIAHALALRRELEAWTPGPAQSVQ